MRSAILSQFAVALVALSETSASMGLKLRRDLNLIAEMGVDPDSVVRDKKSVQAIALESASEEIAAEYVDVGTLSCLQQSLSKIC